jgi:hypothetical protein
MYQPIEYVISRYSGNFTKTPLNFVKIVFDQTTSQVLWKAPRVVKECQQGCHFYKVTLKLYQN